jgi:hypothetical protein
MRPIRVDHPPLGPIPAVFARRHAPRFFKFLGRVPLFVKKGGTHFGTLDFLGRTILDAGLKTAKDYNRKSPSTLHQRIRSVRLRRLAADRGTFRWKKYRETEAMQTMTIMSGTNAS